MVRAFGLASGPYILIHLFPSFTYIRARLDNISCMRILNMLRNLHCFGGRNNSLSGFRNRILGNVDL